MIIRNTWMEFNERYLSNIMDCNGNYVVEVHVLSERGDIDAAKAAVNDFLGTTLPTRFCEMTTSSGFGYAYETVVGIVCADQRKALDLIRLMKELPYRIDV